MTDWQKLVSVFPEYRRLMTEGGVKEVSLVQPTSDIDGHILARRVFGLQCGAVVAESYLFSRNLQLVLESKIARSAVGNRGWDGGSQGAAPKNESEAAKIALLYFGQARQILS